ncbi:Matrix metalloproteinase-23 [Bagarius yarrelli]|uniref:Matrix metalloproteinase-23 n=1 Tax=Bagarius yarrelli TaxID=175774 RepID=A0A556U1Z5_BAGYA|nr:Matrix metalloproteinase-23 [Bagarius yarrelli]
MVRGKRQLALAVAVGLLGGFLAAMQQAAAFPVWTFEEEADMSGVLIIGIRKDARSHVLHLSRNKRYTLTPEKLKWDKFKLTYKLLSFPRNLMNASDTRRGIAKAFAMWSDVSPFSFREVPDNEEADIKIGFYPVNHTDCLQSYLHHCFDGITGELAHAFFPSTGEIHFDDDEYWILGNMRFSWKKGKSLADRPGTCSSSRDRSRAGSHALAEPDGHHAPQRHADRPQAYNARRRLGTSATKLICKTERCRSQTTFSSTGCAMTARKDVFVLCVNLGRFLFAFSGQTHRQIKHFPFPTVAPTPKPPRTKHKLVAEGRKLTFRCGKKIAAKQGKVDWYKDGELLEFSHPGYITLKNDHISIVANAINEGTYTCIVRKKNKVLTTYSWKLRVRF